MTDTLLLSACRTPGQYQTEADWHNVTVFEPRLLERLRKGVHRGSVPPTMLRAVRAFR